MEVTETWENFVNLVCEPEPDFGKDHDQLKDHILADHPELKIILILDLNS